MHSVCKLHWRLHSAFRPGRRGHIATTNTPYFALRHQFYNCNVFHCLYTDIYTSSVHFTPIPTFQSLLLPRQRALAPVRSCAILPARHAGSPVMRTRVSGNDSSSLLTFTSSLKVTDRHHHSRQRPSHRLERSRYLPPIEAVAQQPRLSEA